MTKKTIKNYILNLINRIIADDFPGMAAEMAYMFVIGIFPLMLLLMSVFGWLGKKTLLYPVLNTLSLIAPSDAINLIKKVLFYCCISIYRQQKHLSVMKKLKNFFPN